MRDDFRAPRWIANGHVQTLISALPVFAPPASFRAPRAEKLAVRVASGGAVVARAWWQDQRARAALVVHGVGGSSESRYAVRAAVALHRAGLHVVRLNLQGAGEGVHDARVLYHAALTGDVADVIAALASDARVTDVALVGFSLGGSVSLKLAGERSIDGLAKVVSLSAPTDLVAVNEILERRGTLPYRAYVVRNLVRMARAFAAAHPHRARYDARSLSLARTIREYDERVIVPMHGFKSAHQYYELASAGPGLASIRVPTLIVHAEDDPMVPGATVKPALERVSSAVRVAWSAGGGHVAWCGGFSEGAWIDTWAMRRVIEFLR